MSESVYIVKVNGPSEDDYFDFTFATHDDFNRFNAGVRGRPDWSIVDIHVRLVRTADDALTLLNGGSNEHD